MKHETVRTSAFAMPLTNPAFPPGPYRFVNREYFIIQYLAAIKASADHLRARISPAGCAAANAPRRADAPRRPQ
jgi:acetoacetate decarboxylase